MRTAIKSFPCLRGMVALSLAIGVLTTSAISSAADMPPIQEVVVYGNGLKLPENTREVTAYVNGSPAVVTYSDGAFSLGKFTVNGNPGIVNVVYNIEIGGRTETESASFQTVSSTMNVNTGALTMTGTDSDNGPDYQKLITVDVDGTTFQTRARDGAFSTFGIGNINDRIIEGCVFFDSEMRVCSSVMALDKEKVSDPEPTPEEVAARDEEQDKLAEKNYGGVIRGLGEQLSDIMVYQLPIIGMLLDAKHQLETQRLFGEAGAEAHRDYLPDEDVCAFGTLARSTAPAKFKVDDNASVINTILQKRETLNINTVSSWGPGSDFISRIDQYKKKYCDPNDNDGEIKASGICQTQPTAATVNKDVDYRRTISSGLTLDLDFTDGTVTQDEEDVLALAKNLYAHTIISAIPEQSIGPYSSTYSVLQDTRMLSAVRSVARDSYASIAASKAKGSGLSATQVSQVIQNLGVPAADVTSFIGANPSYFAQMEIFTQKIFQDPNFYTNLYMNPANVSRMKVVLQAVRLMADRDRFEEGLRREMLISMLLEMRLRQAQNADSNNATNATGNAGGK